jgi:hypothetical protein
MEPSAEHGEIEKSGSLDQAPRTVAEVGGKVHVELRKVARDLNHHLGLVQGTADQQRFHKTSIQNCR